MVVQRLRPVALYVEFRVAWRAGDSATANAAFVRVVLETCGRRDVRCGSWFGSRSVGADLLTCGPECVVFTALVAGHTT